MVRILPLQLYFWSVSGFSRIGLTDSLNSIDAILTCLLVCLYDCLPRAGAAAAMLGEVIALAGSDFANANDQKLVADMYMAKKHGIRVDFFAGMLCYAGRTTVL